MAHPLICTRHVGQPVPTMAVCAMRCDFCYEDLASLPMLAAACRSSYARSSWRWHSMISRAPAWPHKPSAGPNSWEEPDELQNILFIYDAPMPPCLPASLLPPALLLLSVSDLCALVAPPSLLAPSMHFRYVPHVFPAERSILSVACRQLAYKAAKLGSPSASLQGRPSAEAAGGSSSTAAPPPDASSLPLSLEELTQYRERIERLKKTLEGIPGAAPLSTAPPPLILSDADVHLGRPSLPLLLGDGSGGVLLPPPQAAASAGVTGSGSAGGGDESSEGSVRAVKEAYELEAAGEISAVERQRRIAAINAQQAPGSGDMHGVAASVGIGDALEGVEVLGLYFGASWCPSCRSTTPVLASAYKALRARGSALEMVYVSQVKRAECLNPRPIQFESQGGGDMRHRNHRRHMGHMGH